MYAENLLIQIQTLAEEIIQSIEEDIPLPPFGLMRSARLPFIAALKLALGVPILYLTNRRDRAFALSNELGFWIQKNQVYLFPEPTPLFYENAEWGESTRINRLQILTNFVLNQETNIPVVVAPTRAVITRTIPKDEFIKASFRLSSGQLFSPERLVRSLFSLGYKRSNIVVTPGQFAKRGGIVDIWTLNTDRPYRIDFFDEEIDSIRKFDPGTQRSIKNTSDNFSEGVFISPAREFLLQPDIVSDEREDNITEFQIPLLHSEATCLMDFLPEETIIIFDDFQEFFDTFQEIDEQSQQMRQDEIANGKLAPDFPMPYQPYSEVLDRLSTFRVIDLGYTMPNNFIINETTYASTQTITSQFSSYFKPGPRFGGQVKQLIPYISEATKKGDQFIIVSRQAERLKELWNAYKFDNINSSPVIIKESLSEGWILSPLKKAPIHLLTDSEMFGWRRPVPRKRTKKLVKAPEDIYQDFKENEYVVHVDHGIGKFIGLVRRTIDNMEREYLCIEYANNAELYVPVHQADRLTRYVGPDNKSPKPATLGNTEWLRTKSRVKEAVKEIAEDLLELYAKRNQVKGHAFSPDTVWQQELEASFPYFETEDQIRVIQEVKHDMEISRPMDRLICGDVGYGKTEIALRAAFKTVMDNKQVAILVPTTVLAQQHFNTFQQRLTAFPVQVEMLSRFRSPQQQKEIIHDLELGKVDIIIGTHRLLSQDVKFKDLGLLIIDEEQRFGVSHKEKLKMMRTEVDVLTLTATPIPRTLYMALSGVRDISTINTPPEERVPVITHVGPYSPEIVRNAILRELERGGQVFFVHNRVQTIGAIHNHLKQLVPEARITIAHGQMSEKQLSKRMDEFTQGKIDILLSTSIIESGLDIPNANTLIVDRADMFGLAQLYQLRGRVGRGAQRAYAYFFRHKRRIPTKEAKERLETIAENTQLGAGLTIAMRDLEIRGAGDILGARQHGHIASVGFQLYTNLLAEAVKNLQGENKPLDTHSILSKGAAIPSIAIDIPLQIGIPADYVPDLTTRLGLYRRISNIQTMAELDDLADEFLDRFGTIPESVSNLLYQLEIKILARKAGLSSVSIENNQIVLRYPSGKPPTNLQNISKYVRIGKTALWIPIIKLPNWQENLTEILKSLFTEKAIL